MNSERYDQSNAPKYYICPFASPDSICARFPLLSHRESSQFGVRTDSMTQLLQSVCYLTSESFKLYQWPIAQQHSFEFREDDGENVLDVRSVSTPALWGALFQRDQRPVPLFSSTPSSLLSELSMTRVRLLKIHWVQRVEACHVALLLFKGPDTTGLLVRTYYLFKGLNCLIPRSSRAGLQAIFPQLNPGEYTDENELDKVGLYNLFT